jgi:hypothetical protein
MKRLFKVIGPNGEWDCKYYEKKYDAKQRRNQLNDTKLGHSVRNGPDHWRGDAAFNAEHGRV